MLTSTSILQIIIRYDAALQRYARMLVKKPEVAAAIVKEVFERLFELNGFRVNDATLRSLLKGSVHKMSGAWLLQNRSVPEIMPAEKKPGN